MSLPSPLDYFTSAARTMATRTAIHHDERSCSYAELQSASDYVAERLRALEVGPGDVIGIALERSIEWMTAMLGILKCGAAYLPLDPAYPPERLALCIADGGVRHIVSDPRNHAIGQDKILMIDALAAPATDMLSTDESTDRFVDDDRPAYLLYTSGSTGRPKGVVVSRGALAYQMNWFVREFACTSEDVFLQKTSTAFDASVWEYLAPLMVGATMVIVDNTPTAITEAARRHRATILQVVPAMLQAMADPASLRDLGSLRTLFCGGEPLPRRLVEQVQTHLAIPLVNLYGPTEATVQCAFHVCLPGDNDKRDPVPLGQPLPSTTFRVDDDGATDGSGELIITGPGIAHGYHNLPDLTAKRFGLSNNGQRSYRSGDRVIRDRYGDYLFLGRTDNQIKLRGLRIELEEIEHALAHALPAIRGAIAIVNQAEQIEAFVQVHANEWDEHAARQALAAALPGFMQPASYTVLEQFPVLPNGKRDRAALRSLSAIHACKTECQPQIEENASDIAARVRAAWSKLLPHSAADDSHFFRAGGHSLLAMQLIAALNRDFGLRLSASALFAQPTLRALTGMVKTAVHDAEARRMPAQFVKLGGQAGKPRIWFIHPAGGGIWCYRDIAQAIETTESYGIACEPRDNEGTYENDLRRMAHHYADLILAQQPNAPITLCGYSFGGNVAYEMAVYLRTRGVEVALLVLLDTFISKPAVQDTLDFIASYARKLVNGGDDAPSKTLLSTMPAAERNRMLLDLGIRGGHLPADATVHDVETGLAMWVANNQAGCTHEPSDVYEGITLFIRCMDNDRDSLEGWPPLLRWLHVQDVAAGHYTLYRAPAAAHVAAQIDQAVQRTMQGSTRAAA